MHIIWLFATSKQRQCDVFCSLSFGLLVQTFAGRKFRVFASFFSHFRESKSPWNLLTSKFAKRKKKWDSRKLNQRVLDTLSWFYAKWVVIGHSRKLIPKISRFFFFFFAKLSPRESFYQYQKQTMIQVWMDINTSFVAFGWVK